jgi:hypothetical protein
MWSGHVGSQMASECPLDLGTTLEHQSLNSRKATDGQKCLLLHTPGLQNARDTAFV